LARLQLSVVCRLSRRIEQRYSRRRYLVEELLRFLTALACLKRPQVQHRPIGSVGDHVRVRFIHGNAEQPIVIRRLLVGRNAEPGVVGIKRL
jgi:hypothetical protein